VSRSTSDLARPASGLAHRQRRQAVAQQRLV